MRGLAVAVWLAVAASGCINADFVACDNGLACPRGDVCDTVHATCVSPEQIATCQDQAFGAACQTSAIAGGGCFDGVCLPRGCGNHVVEADQGEQCDDGNQVSGDGCSGDCTSNERCGNGVLDPGEACEDGNLMSRDGCDSLCKTETAEWDEIPLSPATGSPAAYDEGRGRLVVAEYDSVWELVGDRWQVIDASAGEYEPGFLTYDATRGQVIAVESVSTAQDINKYNLQLVAWDGQAWQPIGTPSPVADSYATGIFHDPTAALTYVFNGTSNALQVWTVDAGGTWTSIANLPRYFNQPSVQVDPDTGDLVLLGLNATAAAYRLDAGAWIQEALPGPENSEYSMVQWRGTLRALDLESCRMYVRQNGAWSEQTGELFPTTAGTLYAYGAATLYADTTADQLSLVTQDGVAHLDSAGWHALDVPTSDALAIADAQGLHLRGPAVATTEATEHAWQVSSKGFTSADVTMPRDARSSASCASVPGRAATVCVGGYTLALSPQFCASTDALDETGWHTLDDTLTDQGAYGPVGYDPTGRRLLMAGYQTLSALADDGTAWTPITPAGFALPEFGQVLSIAWDAHNARMVFTWSAQGQGPGTTSVGGLYELAGSDWEQVALAPAVGMTAIANERRGTVLLVEAPGPGTFGQPDTVWERTGDTWTHELPLPRAASISSTAYASSTGELLVVGRGDGGGTYAWIHRYVSATPLESCEPTEDLDGDGLAGCADPDCYWKCGGCPPYTTCRALP